MANNSRQYLSNLMNGSTTVVRLEKDGKEYNGLYNGFSFWGKVFDDSYVIIEELIEEDDPDEGVPYNFNADSFERLSGYQLVGDSKELSPKLYHQKMGFSWA